MNNGPALRQRAAGVLVLPKHSWLCSIPMLLPLPGVPGCRMPGFLMLSYAFLKNTLAVFY
jgi:hypothetical protein